MKALFTLCCILFSFWGQTQPTGTVTVRRGLLDELFISEWQATNGRTYFKFNRNGIVFSNSSNDTQAYILRELEKNGSAGRTLEGFYHYEKDTTENGKQIELYFPEFERTYTGFLFSGQDFLFLKVGKSDVNPNRTVTKGYIKQHSPDIMFMRYNPESENKLEDLYPKINNSYKGGKVPAEYFTEGLEIKVNEKVDVISFDVVTISKGKKVTLTANDNQFTSEMTKVLNNLPGGTYVTIGSILGEDKQGHIARLRTMEYMIEKEK
jgi:hypothetical protein